MIQEYSIKGITCGGCLSAIRKELEKEPKIKDIDLQLDNPQLRIESEPQLSTQALQLIIPDRFLITPYRDEPSVVETRSFWLTYQPLFLIVLFIAGISLLTQWPFETFHLDLWMRHFMAGFFLAFSFFKLLDVKGFASAYRMYDLLAARWPTWGFIYPLAELSLGIAYLIDFYPLGTNIATVILLGFGSLGVIESNLNKRKIKCACLGSVFNLPMSVVTIVENVAMIVMAMLMLAAFLH